MQTAFSQISAALKKYSDEKFFIELAKNKGFLTLCADFMRMRLENHGVTPQGREIRTFKARQGNVYAQKTISIRKKLGLQTGHVDLKQTGQFHNSIKAVRKGLEIMQIGQTKKTDGDILDNVEYTDIFGFSDQDIENAIKYLINKDIAKQAFTKTTGIQ
jgi:hypothetical protein